MARVCPRAGSTCWLHALVPHAVGSLISPWVHILVSHTACAGLEWWLEAEARPRRAGRRVRPVRWASQYAGWAERASCASAGRE